MSTKRQYILRQTYSLKLKAACLFKYVWPFDHHGHSNFRKKLRSIPAFPRKIILISRNISPFLVNDNSSGCNVVYYVLQQKKKKKDMLCLISIPTYHKIWQSAYCVKIMVKIQKSIANNSYKLLSEHSLQTILNNC